VQEGAVSSQGVRSERCSAGLEPGQVWRTKAGELWCVTEVNGSTHKVSFVILYSKQESVVGRLSWCFPTKHSITLWQRVS
jgi:hypothetical protein